MKVPSTAVVVEVSPSNCGGTVVSGGFTVVEIIFEVPEDTKSLSRVKLEIVVMSEDIVELSSDRANL